jgi:hypothetical protein
VPGRHRLSLALLVPLPQVAVVGTQYPVQPPYPPRLAPGRCSKQSKQ